MTKSILTSQRPAPTTRSQATQETGDPPSELSFVTSKIYIKDEQQTLSASPYIKLCANQIEFYHSAGPPKLTVPWDELANVSVSEDPRPSPSFLSSVILPWLQRLPDKLIFLLSVQYSTTSPYILQFIFRETSTLLQCWWNSSWNFLFLLYVSLLTQDLMFIVASCVHDSITSEQF